MFGLFSMPSIHREHAPYFLGKKAFVILLCSTFCRWMGPVRIPVDSSRYFLSALPMCWAYLLVMVSKCSLLVRKLSQTFHSACFLFHLKTGSGKVSGPANLIFTHFPLPLCDSSLPRAKTCPA